MVLPTWKCNHEWLMRIKMLVYTCILNIWFKINLKPKLILPFGIMVFYSYYFVLYFFYSILSFLNY